MSKRDESPIAGASGLSVLRPTGRRRRPGGAGRHCVDDALAGPGPARPGRLGRTTCAGLAVLPLSDSARRRPRPRTDGQLSLSLLAAGPERLRGGIRVWPGILSTLLYCMGFADIYPTYTITYTI